MCLWHVWSWCSFVLKYNIHLNALDLPRNTEGILANSECFRFITVALLWRAGDWAGTANMTVLSPWPRVKVMSLSKMNHSSSPEGPPGLLLKLYIIVFWKVREEEKKNCIWEQWSLTERSCILHKSLFVCIFFLYQCEEKLWMILLDLFPKNYSRVMFT